MQGLVTGSYNVTGEQQEAVPRRENPYTEIVVMQNMSLAAARLLIPSLLVLFLSACGGGSSDDGAGSSGGVVFSATGTFAANSSSVPVALTITVRGNTVTVTDGTDSGSGKLNANGTSFTVGINVQPDPAFPVSCNSPVLVNGEIMGTTVSGTFSGSAVCSTGGVSVPLTFSGSYRGSQTGNARAPLASGIRRLISNSI